MSSFEFPQQLVEKYKPQRLEDFIGLHKPKTILQAYAQRPYATNWLFIGYSGIGKTTMAWALANAIAAEIHHIPSGKATEEEINRVCNYCHYVPMLPKRYHAIIVDEAHELPKPTQLALLSRTDSTNKPPGTVFILTANSVKQLAEPFLSRFKVLLFEYDSLESELPRFLEKIYKKECGKKLADSHRLCKESGYNVRDALNSLEVELLYAKEK